MPPYARPSPYTDNLPNSNNLPKSEFLVHLWVTSGRNPLHTFAEPSGAWEVPI